MEKACFHSTAGHCLGPAPPPPCPYPPASSQHGAALETDGHTDTHTHTHTQKAAGTASPSAQVLPTAVPLLQHPSPPPSSSRLQLDAGVSQGNWEQPCASDGPSPPCPVSSGKRRLPAGGNPPPPFEVAPGENLRGEEGEREGRRAHPWCSDTTPGLLLISFHMRRDGGVKGYREAAPILKEKKKEKEKGKTEVW